MDPEVHDDYAALKREQVREQEATLDELEAHAKEAEANEELLELTGLRRLQTQLQEKLELMKSRAKADQAQERVEFDQAWQRLTTKRDEITSRLKKIDQASGERLDAQLDQLDAEIRAVDARIAQEDISMDIETKQALEQLHEEQRVANERRRQVAAAKAEAKRELNSSFKKAVEDLKGTWHLAQAKVESARHGTGLAHRSRRRCAAPATTPPPTNESSRGG